MVLDGVFCGVLDFVGVFDDDDVFRWVEGDYFIDDCVDECGFVWVSIVNDEDVLMCCDGVFNDFVLFVGYDVCFDVLF